MKKWFLIILLFVFIISLSCVSAVEDVNQTIYDDTNDLVSGEDTLSVSLSEDELSAKDDGTFTALQKKIDNAREGAIINLENDYKYDEGFSTDGITINKALTIEGNGYLLDEKNALFEFYTFKYKNNIVE